MGQLHELSLWAHQHHVADITHVPLNDDWTLRYAGDWAAHDDSFALSPSLPLKTPPQGYRSTSIRRFLENLLPEGRALDIIAASQGVAKTNVYGLIQALGAETTGAFRFLPQGEDGTTLQPERVWREVTLQELDQRITDRDQHPLVAWDGPARMAVAGHQDKLLVYVDGRLEDGARMILPDYPLASTHILKPQPSDHRLRHMVVNEHYCMTLARTLGFPVAEVAILRTPQPVLAVTRFDRTVHRQESGAWVERRHIIDVCQACDLPVSYKYERNIGSVGDAANYRDGVSLPKMFEQLRHIPRKAIDRLSMLRWALYQFVIGNSDAHGKNFSFYVQRTGLTATPWYDLVSVVQYPQFSHEMAMAFGDEFNLDNVKGYALADFAQRCGIERQLLLRESRKLSDGIRQHALTVLDAAPYLDDEREFARGIAEFALEQVEKLSRYAKEAVAIPADYF
jgi:serine/threonine-protein kinase HipA